MGIEEGGETAVGMYILKKKLANTWIPLAVRSHSASDI